MLLMGIVFVEETPRAGTGTTENFVVSEQANRARRASRLRSVRETISRE